VKYQPKGTPELTTSFKVKGFPAEGDDFSKQRFVKGMMYEKFQEVLSVYFDCKVFGKNKELVFQYRDFFAHKEDRRTII